MVALSSRVIVTGSNEVRIRACWTIVVARWVAHGAKDNTDFEMSEGVYLTCPLYVLGVV